MPVLPVQLPQCEEDNGWTTVNVLKKDGQPWSIVLATKLHIVDKVDMEGGTGKISWTVRIGQGRTGPKRHLPLMVRRWVYRGQRRYPTTVGGAHVVCCMVPWAVVMCVLHYN